MGFYTGIFDYSIPDSEISNRNSHPIFEGNIGHMGPGLVMVLDFMGETHDAVRGVNLTVIGDIGENRIIDKVVNRGCF